METEIKSWWQKGDTLGATLLIQDEEGNVIAETGDRPSDSDELTEEEFVSILRAKVMFERSQHVIKAAQDAAAIAQLQTTRQEQVDELVAFGISEPTAQVMIPPAPSGVPSLGYQVPQEIADFLRSAYYLSQESIDAVLAPVEEP